MYLYVVVAENGLFKVGKTFGSPKKRVSQILTSSPIECALLFSIEYDEAQDNLEERLHNTFADKRVRGEWFALSLYDIGHLLLEAGLSEVDIIGDLLAELGEWDKWGFFKLGQWRLESPTSRAVVWRAAAMSREF